MKVSPERWYVSGNTVKTEVTLAESLLCIIVQ